MKIVKLKEFLKLESPLLYIRVKEGVSLEKQPLEVKVKSNSNTWEYKYLFGLFNNSESELENSINSLRDDKDLSLKNETLIKTNTEDCKEFLIFELEDIENTLIPVASCFDLLTKQTFSKKD